MMAHIIPIERIRGEDIEKKKNNDQTRQTYDPTLDRLLMSLPHDEKHLIGWHDSLRRSNLRHELRWRKCTYKYKQQSSGETHLTRDRLKCLVSIFFTRRYVPPATIVPEKMSLRVLIYRVIIYGMQDIHHAIAGGTLY